MKCVTALMIGLSAAFGSLGHAQAPCTDHAPQEAPSADKEKNVEDDFGRTKMFPDGRIHNFGKVQKGKICKQVFRIVNTTNAPMKIVSVRAPSCAVLSVGGQARYFALKADGSEDRDNQSRTLRPNEVGKLEIIVDSRSLVGRATGVFYVVVDASAGFREFRFPITLESADKPAN